MPLGTPGRLLLKPASIKAGISPAHCVQIRGIDCLFYAQSKSVLPDTCNGVPGICSLSAAGSTAARESVPAIGKTSVRPESRATCGVARAGVWRDRQLLRFEFAVWYVKTGGLDGLVVVFRKTGGCCFGSARCGQRRRRSLIRRNMFGPYCRRLGACKYRRWSRELPDRLPTDRGRHHPAGGPEQLKPHPSIHRTLTGCTQVYGFAD